MKKRVYNFQTRQEAFYDPHHHSCRSQWDFVLELATWHEEVMVKTRHVPLTKGQLMVEWFEHIFDVFKSIFAEEVARPKYKVKLVDDVRNHDAKRSNYHTLEGMVFDLREQERWQYDAHMKQLIFKLDRVPDHTGPLFIPVVYFHGAIDDVTTEECRAILLHDAALPIAYPHVEYRLRIKWHEMMMVYFFVVTEGGGMFTIRMAGPLCGQASSALTQTASKPCSFCSSTTALMAASAVVTSGSMQTVALVPIESIMARATRARSLDACEASTPSSVRSPMYCGVNSFFNGPMVMEVRISSTANIHFRVSFTPHSCSPNAAETRIAIKNKPLIVVVKMFVRTLGTLYHRAHSREVSYHDTENKKDFASFASFVHVSTVVKIKRYDAQVNAQLVYGDLIDFLFFETWNCNDDTHRRFVRDYRGEAGHCTCTFEALYPVYVITTPNCKYVVHPDERQKMADLLSPPPPKEDHVQALVHELRYNVDIVRDVEKHEEDFYENKRMRNE